MNSRLRVVAGPGTGKSFAMKRRVARLLSEGVKPAAILPVTFTRVAAEDLQRELAGMAVPGSEQLRATTLHRLALRILMRNSVLNVIGRVPRTLSDFELEPMYSDLAKAHGGKREVKKLKAAYEAAWARLQQEDPGYADSPEDKAFARDLKKWLQFHNGMLIGEVVPVLYAYLLSNPGAVERNEYSHILVDEFQDLNRAEQELVSLLSDSAEVCIVGDDDQSIYGFKHAHPEGIREWLTQNAGAADLGLEDCRRCPTRVVAMANELISHNELRPVPRQLKPMAQNGEGDVRILQYSSLENEIAGIQRVVAELLDNGIAHNEILILTQSRAFGTPIYEALRRTGIPVKSYFAEAELSESTARTVLSFLTLLADRSDRVALRWLLGAELDQWNTAGYLRVRAHCENTGISPWDALTQLVTGDLRLPYTKPIIAAFTTIQERLNRLENFSHLNELIEELLPEGQESTRDLRELALRILGTDESMSRQTFVAELRSAINQPEAPSDVEEVRIMSLHKSKGLSSPVTIIAGCVEGLLPRPPGDSLATNMERLQHLEEQRRLFYVGITRVKAEPAAGKPGTLILTSSQEMPSAKAWKAGITAVRHREGLARLHASRFLSEMVASAPKPTKS